MGSRCCEAGSSSSAGHRAMSLMSNIWQEVTEKATELHKVEQRIPKIQRSLDEADVSGSIGITVIGSTLGRSKNSTQLLSPSRCTRENTKISVISTIL